MSEGKYVQRDANYWAASGRAIFEATLFYLPVEAIDPFGEHSFVTYDSFAVLITGTRDPLFNLTSADNDYRVLAPVQVTDANLNRAAVAFDALGMVVKTAVMGKANAVPAEGDTLADPTTRLEYDLLRWQTQQTPVFVHTFAREQHGAANPRFQETFAYSDGFGRVAMQKVQAEPEPGSTTPRWVGTGRTVFNNKGNPVKQYEPFFSATSDFEDEDAIVATGVTPIIHYDPLDRVIRTELPDGSESRVEFDVWVQRTFDPNDAVVGTRWLTEHQAGTADEQRAALLALQHADTPTMAHLDSLGRAFLVQADNGPDPATPAGPHRLYDTRTRFDIEGNVVSITDARDLQVIEQRFDVLQRRLRVDSPDAGARLAIADVGGKPLRAWDSRGQTIRSLYDALQRPTHLYVKQGAAERLLLRTVFGEALDPVGAPTPVSQAQSLNLRRKPYLSFDCAGLVTTGSFDFKGNLLSSSRRLAADYTTEPNWIAAQNIAAPDQVLVAVSALLETEHFDDSSTYDALNRITTRTTPDGSVTRPTYNEANLLEALFASVRGATEQTVIADLDYNARGQRTSCQYGNGTTTTYTYDAKTFRLTELETLRGATKLQRLVYTFDPVGNIVALRDQSDTAPIFSGTAPVSGDGLYEYDPLYRLLSATGREHPATQPVDTDPPDGTGIPHANDLQALLAYSETYVYDKVGNIQQMAHLAGPSGSLGWTRNYQYATDSNRLLKTSVPGSPLNLSETYAYDAHGSMTSMPHLAVMDWDYADRLTHTQKGSGSGAQHTHFTYDAAGQRVRKAAVASGTVKERIYLGGYEVYRERAATSGVGIDFERQTLHLMDVQHRVAMAETKTVDGGAAVPTPTSRWRFHLDNHLGSASLELDASGNVISYEEYHPYGSTAFLTADGAAQVSAKRYRYTGKEKDDETGLYYHGARYYAPWLGRWTAADPLGMKDGLNVYRYSRDNPITFSDPGGTETENTIDDILKFLRDQAGFETGAARPPTFDPKSASAFGTAAHKKATDVLAELKAIGVKGAERIYSEVRVVGGVVTDIGKGPSGAPKGSLNPDIVVAKPGQTIAQGQSLSGGVAESIGDLKYGGGEIAPKYGELGSPLKTINGSSSPGAAATATTVAAEAPVAAAQAEGAIASAEKAIGTVASEVAQVEKVAPAAAAAAESGSRLAKVAAVLKPLAPLARVAGKVAAPVGVVLTAAQVATAKTQEEKVDAGISVASTGLLLSGNPIAAAGGAGLAGGQILESALGVSDFSAAHGETARQALTKLGAGDDLSLVGGAIVTVAATPLALGEAAVSKGYEKAKGAVDWVRGLW